MTILYWAVGSFCVLMIILFLVCFSVAFYTTDSSPNKRKNASDIKPYMKGRKRG